MESKAPFAFLTNHTVLQSFQILLSSIGTQDLMHIIAYLLSWIQMGIFSDGSKFELFFIYMPINPG